MVMQLMKACWAKNTGLPEPRGPLQDVYEKRSLINMNRERKPSVSDLC